MQPETNRKTERQPTNTKRAREREREEREARERDRGRKRQQKTTRREANRGSEMNS